MTQVRVGVRVRPLTTKEHSQGGKSVVEARAPCVGIGSRSFTYDQAFDTSVSQASLYQRVSPVLLSSFLEGYNATIMAYGQTGSGKTYTMGSEANTEGEGGLIPRFMASIFESLELKKAQSENIKEGPVLVDFSVQASFLEVYGEDVHDLLDSERRPLPLRDDAKGGVVVSGLASKNIASADEALEVLHLGTLNRTTAATLMNLTSSRSHAVFTVYLSQTTHVDEVDVTTSSKFTFVDLAGSERMKKTGAEGERAREGIKINEGLLALGNVINALADESRLAKKEKIHVPYRQSKLTRLLQDALGGNSQTLFIACVSPADTNASETLSTLHYANRARNIKNAPTKNVNGAGELQQLHALNAIFWKELVAQKFGNAGNVMEEDEVKNYLQELQLLAEQNGGSSAPLPALAPSSAAMPPIALPSISEGTTTPLKSRPITTPFRSMTPTRPDSTDSKEDMLDQSMLEDVNPEEELAILDQLLELQSQDQEFNKNHKEGQEELKLVQVELDEQEALLLQLRDSLKVYHNMKEKFQMLMAEVQQLEVEKTSLADQLEKASADPTKGCSLAIKKKLERVNASLVRARSDTRKHQQKYREAEQQAQKCKALERKIDQLKQGKVAMIKKQKAATARHREYTETKTKELMVMKKKERIAGKKVTRLQTEIQIHKTNLSKRKVYTDKVTSKLKETESHLMKLLSMRQRELRQRNVGPGRRTSVRIPLKDAGFAKQKSQELESMTFLLNRLVVDRVNLEQARLQYQEGVADYSAIMRKIVAEVRLLDAMKNQSNVDQATFTEQEQTVEELELKLEIISGELEELRNKIGSATDDDDEDSTKIETQIEKKAKETVGSLDAKSVRTLLWEFVDNFSEAELERQRQSRCLVMKDSVIESFEAEVRSLTEKTHLLTNDLTERRQLTAGKEDPMESIRDLQKQLQDVTAKYEQANDDVQITKEASAIERKSLQSVQLELMETKEKLALAETIVRHREDAQSSERSLEVLQTLWRRIGVPEEERVKARRAILSCLEDTCQRQVRDTRSLKVETESEIRILRETLSTMTKALGKSADSEEPSPTLTLFEDRDQLQDKIDLVKPEYDSAVERKDQIIKSVNNVVRSMDLSKTELSSDLRALLECTVVEDIDEDVRPSGKAKRAEMMKNVEGMLQALAEGNEDEDDTDADMLPPTTLEVSYLDRCDKDLSNLRMKKSRKTVANSEMRNEAHQMAKDMHVSIHEVNNLVFNSTSRALPNSWSNAAFLRVAEEIIEEDGIVEVSNSFTEHLEHIHGVLQTVSEQRRMLSSDLKSVINRAQKTLLSTVGEEVDASEAYVSFHEALFDLPPLSKEHIQACIEEINALTAGVEAMTQSEIEALAVVWDALHIPTMERSEFWGDTEKASKASRSKDGPVFESIQPDTEEWVSEAAKEASKIYSMLSVRLHKLDRVHGEVERLRSKQDAKSRIISLDSEIRILTATLAEFEEKQCNKQRLLTKKAGSSTLLKEERFRKQMQGKFTSKMGQLIKAVKSWQESDGNCFDGDILSEEVQMLLNNPDKMDKLAEKRTEFMHLRTVQSKLAGKRPALHRTSSSESPVKKQRLGDRSSAGSSNSNDIMRDTTAKKAARPMRVTRARSATAKALAENAVAATPAPAPTPTPAPASTRIKRRQEVQSRSPLKPRTRQRKQETAEKLKSAATSNDKKTKTSKKTTSAKTKRETMMPFGNILEGEISPDMKENMW